MCELIGIKSTPKCKVSVGWAVSQQHVIVKVSKYVGKSPFKTTELP